MVFQVSWIAVKHTQDARAEIEYFDKFADNYSACFEEIARSMCLELFELLQFDLEKQPLKILDVGCGSGVTGRMLAEKGYEVTGIDLSPKMVDLANRKAGGSPFHALVGDITRTSFSSDHFDLCLSISCLHHFLDPVPALEEISRVLKMGGRLVLVEPNGSNPIVRLSRLLGFVLERLGKLKGATKNERVHNCKDYKLMLERAGLKVARTFSYSISAELDIRALELPEREKLNYYFPQDSKILGSLLRARKGLYQIVERIFPQPYGGSYLVIVSRKERGNLPGLKV